MGIVSFARRASASEPWRVQPQFALHLHAAPAVYRDVVALEFGNLGRSLLVLSSKGELHGWDLTTGAMLGRWTCGAQAKAMCLSGQDLLVIRQREDGPILEVVPQYMN